MKRQNVAILLLPLFILVFLSAAFFFLASEPSSDNEPNSNAPNGPDGSEFNDWKTSTPEQQGLSSVQLALME
ncbi:MAG: hypothetical protein ACXAEI_20490, partial [Candidatus Hodarchaeales archaeon]